MGVGGALRWQPGNTTLRSNLDAVVSGIAACKDADGFIMAYDKNTTARTEHPDYVCGNPNPNPSPNPNPNRQAVGSEQRRASGARGSHGAGRHTGA